MRARVVAGVVGLGIGLLTVSAGAQTPSAAFPSETAGNAAAPAASAVPAAAPAGEAPPVATAPPTTPAAPAPLPVSAPQPARPAALPEPAQPQSVPSWTVGAGILSNGSLMMPVEQSTATYNATLERRLGSRAWLALNARFSYVKREAPLSSTTAEAEPGETYHVGTSSAGVLLGVRYVFAHGLVDVSGSGAAFLNYQHVEGNQGNGVLAPLGTGSKRELGLLLGMAVERELIEALALRLSLDLASAGVGFQDSPWIDDVGVEQPRTLVTGRLGFAIEPGLHLHFYF